MKREEKKNVRKLQLKKDTVRKLTPDQLKQAGGGIVVGISGPQCAIKW